MLVPVRLPGVQVTVNVDGTPLHEYADSDSPDSPETVTRYIAASSDKVFEIHMDAEASTVWEGDALLFKIKIDGQVFSNMATYNYSGHRVGVCRGKRTSTTELQQCCFKDLHIDGDKPGATLDIANMGALGSIVVEVHHKWRGPIVPYRDKGDLKEEITSVSEKAIKGAGLSHSVGFSGVLNSVNTRRRDKYVNSSKKPAATFVFLYRSIEKLKEMLIVPRTPSPTPQGEEDEEVPLHLRDPATLTLADVARLQAKIKQESVLGIKRELTDNGELARKASRPRLDGKVLEVQDDDTFRESSPTLGIVKKEPEVIELE